MGERRRRSRFNPRRSKPEGKGLARVGMNQGRLLPERHEFVSQLEPAAQTAGRVGHASRPRNAGERSSHTEEIRILPDFEERHPRPFRKGQFEVARLGKTNEHFADQARPLPFIEKLAVARLPVGSWSDELVDRSAAGEGECDECKKSGLEPHETASSASAGDRLKSFCGMRVRRGQSGRYRCTLTSR